MPARMDGNESSNGSLFDGNRIAKVTNDTTTQRISIGYAGYGLYAPLSIKYIPLGAQRRFQPYFIVGLGTMISGTRKYTTLYDPDFLFQPVIYSSEQEPNGTRILFAAQAGVGLNVRLYNRVHLSTELLITRNLRRDWFYGGGASMGLLYDFAPKSAK